jgi:hypothetical protein
MHTDPVDCADGTRCVPAKAGTHLSATRAAQWVPACAGTTAFMFGFMFRCRDQFIAAAGRSFFTSASGGCTLAPSTYLKSAIVPLPFLRAILPT